MDPVAWRCVISGVKINPEADRRGFGASLWCQRCTIPFRQHDPEDGRVTTKMGRVKLVHASIGERDENIAVGESGKDRSLRGRCVRIVHDHVKDGH